MAPGAHATRLPSLLVGDVVIRHPDFAGLDSAAELFATDLPEAHPETPRWGTFWAAALRDAPPLPGVVRALLPEEGGFVLRPLLDSPQLDSSCRRLLAPCREVHAELGFPEPALISNDVFVEVRYAMAASTLGWFDFEDIREGTLRLFAIPGFEGDVRIITVVDEAAAATILSAQAALSTAPQVPGAPKTVQNKRLHQFLHCVATSPAAARWPTTAMIKDGAGIPRSTTTTTTTARMQAAAGIEELDQTVLPKQEASGLFPHQAATIAWMQRVEGAGQDSLKVELLEFAGELLGGAYEVSLPRGGVIAHPPGSGKTRIVASLVGQEQDLRQSSMDEGIISNAASSTPLGLQPSSPGSVAVFSPPARGRGTKDCEAGVGNKELESVSGGGSSSSNRGRTLVVCPAHLKKQWWEELTAAGASELAAEVVDYEAVAGLLSAKNSVESWARLVVDEPQDCPAGEPWAALLQFISDLRGAGAAVWLLCGTAQSHMDTIGPLLLGRIGWHVASRQSEWQGRPQLAHIVRARFLSDPPWACLPRPQLEVHDDTVILRPRESSDAAVASLAGFILDGVLLLSFGPAAAFAAAQERDQLLLHMGWNCVGMSLLPPAEHELDNWENTVVQRSHQKLEKLSEEIASLEAEESQQGSRYRFAGGDAALAPDLSFLAREAVRVEIEGFPEVVGMAMEEACTAEWNCLLSGHSFQGPLVLGENSEFPHVALLPVPDDGDFVAAALLAQNSGAVAVIFESDRALARPFGYRHDQIAPTLAACMVGPALAAKARAALEVGSLSATVTLITRYEDDEEDDNDGGLITAFIADDAVDHSLDRRLKALRGERDRCQRALRFALQMRALLENNEAHCPVCLHTGAETDAFAVLPDCFHILCRSCLDLQVGIESSFVCPMCRVCVSRQDVVVFRAPEARLRKEDRAIADNNNNSNNNNNNNSNSNNNNDNNNNNNGNSLHSSTADPDDKTATTTTATAATAAQHSNGHSKTTSHGKNNTESNNHSKSNDNGNSNNNNHGNNSDTENGKHSSSNNNGKSVDDTDSTRDSCCTGSELAAGLPALDTSTPAWESMPSKLQRLVLLLREILSSGSEERVLVYTQWAAHVAHLGEVLEKYGLESLALLGELRDTMDVLSRFGSPSEPRILLLSSQRHSSGINLQMARHVVIVHPYCTPTATSQESISRAQMLAFEAQAIGRVRRFPQMQTVHVHRLFAAGTVEEELYSGRGNVM